MGRPKGSLNKTKSPTRVRREARAAARAASGKPARQKRWAQIGLDLPPVPDHEPLERIRRPAPRSTGRPAILNFDEPTLRILFSHSFLQASQEEAAWGLGVSRMTLTAFFREHPTAYEVWEDARIRGRGALRSQVYSEAMNGNAPVLILAAEHMLGMRNRAPAGVDAAMIGAQIETIGAEIRLRVASTC